MRSGKARASCALGGGQPLSTEPRRDRQRRRDRLRTKGACSARKGENGGVRRGGSGSIHITDSHSRRAERRGAPPSPAAANTRARSAPPPHVAVRERPGVRVRPVRPRPPRPPSRPVATAVPTQPEPGARPAPCAHCGWGRRGAARPRTGRGPARSPALAEGRAAARARSAGSSRIPHRSQDAAEPGVACRGGLRGCSDHAGPGFYSGAATGRSPDSGTRVAAPPPGGASPPRVLSLSRNPPLPPPAGPPCASCPHHHHHPAPAASAASLAPASESRPPPSHLVFCLRTGW